MDSLQWLYCKAALLVLPLLCFSTAIARSPFEQFIEWELSSSDLSAELPERLQPVPFSIEHYEIPAAALDYRFSEFANNSIKSSLIFQKNGQSFVRWVIYPERTESAFANQLRTHLISLGVSTERHSYYCAWHTASRSIVLQDPSSHALFSVKQPINSPPGIIQREKPLSWQTALRTLMISDFLRNRELLVPFENIGFFFEEGCLGFPEIDQAMLIRSLAPLEGKNYYAPGFAVMGETIGPQIAALNGSGDPTSFWQRHYAEPMGRMMAELLMSTGLVPEVGHGQQYFAELSAEYRPTGKIYLRDFGDTYLHHPLMKANLVPFADEFPSDLIVERPLPFSVRRTSYSLPLRMPLFYPGLGFKYVSWNRTALPADTSLRGKKTWMPWNEAFWRGADETVSRYLGLPVEEISKSRSGWKKCANYELSIPAFESFLGRQREFCSSLLTRPPTKQVRLPR